MSSPRRSPRGKAAAEEPSPARSTRSTRSTASRAAGDGATTAANTQLRTADQEREQPTTPGGRSTRSSSRRADAVSSPQASSRSQRDVTSPKSPALAKLPADLNDRSPSTQRRRSDASTGNNDGEDDSPLKYQSEAGSTHGGSSRGTTSASTRRAGGRANTVTRTRPDTNTNRRHHHRIQVPDDNAMEFDEPSQPPNDVSSNVVPGTNDDAANVGGPKVVVWGTTICVTDVQNSFRRFLREFRGMADEDVNMVVMDTDGGLEEVDSREPHYMQHLSEIAVTQHPHLNVDLQHVQQFDKALYRQIINYPADVVPYLDMVANQLFYAKYDDVTLPYQIEIRPFNADRTRNMRGLNPEDIDQLITMNGMVIRTSSLIPEMRQGYFECTVCRSKAEVEVDRGRIEEPTVCRNCNNNYCFQLIHNRSLFMDKQIVKLQESPDDMPAGQTPHSVTLYAHGNLVDTIQPGDRVTVTGIYRAMPLRANPRMRTVKAVYRTHIDVLHFRKSDTQRLHMQDDGSHLTNDRIAQIHELAQKPDICERLCQALAPSIYEHDDVKKGIMCLLFGGTRKDLSAAGRASTRSEINMLLCGDPGTAKSQLLQYVHHLVPRSQYTSGKGSSAVGLTAYVTKDPETRHYVLQTGALVLSDNGVCCIDEFDKMNDSTRSVLHEVMEQQTLSITKAGIICQLNARASILAAANPVDSQWNRNKTIVENVQLPHTLLSRFDLIFLLVDPQDEYHDRRLAAHLVSLYYHGSEQQSTEYLDMALLRDYIAYAKAKVEPQLSEEASQRLIDKYLEMRKVGSGRGQVSAYPRQLESLIRLAEANAKIKLCDRVTADDVEEAYRLHREALKQSAVDPLTGKVDVNILAAGVSASTRQRIGELAETIKQRLAQRPYGASFAFKKLLQDIRDGSDRLVSREIFDEAVNDLCKNDVIIRTGDKLRLIRPINQASEQ